MVGNIGGFGDRVPVPVNQPKISKNNNQVGSGIGDSTTIDTNVSTNPVRDTENTGDQVIISPEPAPTDTKALKDKKEVADAWGVFGAEEDSDEPQFISNRIIVPPNIRENNGEPSTLIQAEMTKKNALEISNALIGAGDKGLTILNNLPNPSEIS